MKKPYRPSFRLGVWNAWRVLFREDPAHYKNLRARLNVAWWYLHPNRKQKS